MATRPARPSTPHRHAGLRHSDPTSPGYGRRRAGEGWAFHDARGRVLRNPATVARIRALVIPPAWEEVWICPSPRGHIQATGRDARGRTQYRYHAQWRVSQDETKFHRTLAFGRTLPRIRRAVEADLARPGLDRPKVIAAVVRLLETTLIRVGNDAYARENHSFGLTTLEHRHVHVGSHSDLHFHFRGKSGQFHRIDFTDRRLARIIGRLRDLPGQHLFHYRGDGNQAGRITSSDVNAYIQRVAGDEFSAKDFRTWAGTVLAALALGEFKPFQSQGEARRNVVAAVARVADRLGNTPAICKKAYIHPDIIGAYMDRSTVHDLQRHSERHVRRALRGLSATEWAVLSFLKGRGRARGPRPHPAGNR